MTSWNAIGRAFGAIFAIVVATFVLVSGVCGAIGGAVKDELILAASVGYL